MIIKYKPDVTPLKQSDHDALQEMFGEWSELYSEILLDILEGKLVGSDLVLQSDFLEQVQTGVDTQLSVFLQLACLILYERLSTVHANLDTVVTKKDIKKESFAASYLKSRGKKS
jgi:hypothetical protein